ncbi:Uncharacterized protein OBRU01_14130 [Operophtera brumata]|uniref:Uncharacterized protein n=1 Tax=Operophtera brumata TaxID=104452 RepID=A0A0L7L7L5_OPEBR|nr:Uncharacterized protein OBRU01_14130 [Operophtera brumata]
MQCVTLFFCLVLVSADEYDNKLTKLWSVSRASRDGSVFNVTSASIVIQPSSYANERPSRAAKLLQPYAFKPRAVPIPIRREEPQVEKNVYYTDEAKKYKSEILFPGNYYSISKEKNLEDGEKESKGGINQKIKRKTKLKPKKLKKYMLPLLLAYKLKYFALVPVMIGGLILLVGATGMAGFFFALFAAVMGLQKGGY